MLTQRRRKDEASGQGSRGRELLERHLDLIQQRLKRLGRQSGLPADEAEEFVSWALCKLLEDDCRALASWQGRSSFSTYLTVVLVNLLRDYRVHLWGKWRPSAAARRLGDDAMRLERLWLRDRLPLEEAIDRLLSEQGSSRSRAMLERLADRLPQRVKPRRIGEEALTHCPARERAEARLEDGERTAAADRVNRLLPDLLAALPAEERLMLALHYRDGVSITRIASLLGCAQRELFARRERCLKRLRRGLEAAGLGQDLVSRVINR